MAKVLIFGGTGFIGLNLTTTLLNQGHEVIIFSRSSKSIGNNIRPNIITGDIGNFVDVRSALWSIKPDWVFNCAGVLTRGVSEVDEAEAYRINEQGARNIIDAILELYPDLPIQAGIMLGTAMEYGVKVPILREDIFCEPIGTYAQAKHNATSYMQEVAKKYHVPLVSARVFTPYGPGMDKDSLVLKIINQALAGEQINLSSPEVTRDFIYITDLTEVLIKLISVAQNRQGEVFNVATGIAVTLEQFASEVLTVFNSTSAIVWDKKLKSVYDNRVWQADMEKTFSATGWRPKIGLLEGLLRMKLELFMGVNKGDN